jgi:hypothetical protein
MRAMLSEASSCRTLAGTYVCAYTYMLLYLYILIQALHFFFLEGETNNC